VFHYRHTSDILEPAQPGLQARARIEPIRASPLGRWNTAMNKHAVKAAALAAVMMLTAAAADAAEVTLLISNALKTVMEDLAPRFEAATGHKLAITYGSTNPLKARIEKGEAFDLTILGEAAIDDLVKQGRLVAATRAVVARSVLGVAIRKGAPKPDVGTTESFKRTLLNAKSIAYLEDGLTGTYVKVLFQRLGIAEDMKAKYKSARGAEAVAGGEVELGVTQISEILYQKGAELAGPLPPEIQNYTNFLSAVGAGAKQADAARALLTYFASPDAARVMRANGLEPPG
jgi:molybdate transport system substrate-binding protein